MTPGPVALRWAAGALAAAVLVSLVGSSRASAREPGKATIDRKAYLASIRQSACFQKFEANQEPRGLDFLDMVNAYSHTPSDEIRRSLRLLDTMAGDEKDEQLLCFVKWCRQTFTSYLVDAKKRKKNR